MNAIKNRKPLFFMMGKFNFDKKSGDTALFFFVPWAEHCSALALQCSALQVASCDHTPGLDGISHLVYNFMTINLFIFILI